MADKTERVPTYLTKDDKATIEAAAIKIGMSLAGYLRLSALEKANAGSDSSNAVNRRS